MGKPVTDIGNVKKLTGFPLHTVNCTFHPYGDLSLYDMEKIFQDKFGDMSEFDGFMDFNLGLWTNDLDIYVKYGKKEYKFSIYFISFVENFRRLTFHFYL